MSKKDTQKLMQFMSPEHYAQMAEKERITIDDYKNVPIKNSSMREPYVPTELNYRGKK